MVDMHVLMQVNLDYESEQDMIEKFRIGLALQPVVQVRSITTCAC